MRSRPTRTTTLVDCAFLALGVCALLALGVVAACDRGPSAAERALREARETFVAGDYADAQLQFRRAVPLDRQQATLGVARSHHQLHDYEAALLRYDRALELDPSDSLTWEGYLGALAWGGILEGNGGRLETALASAPAALLAVPENPEIYHHVRTAAAELNRLPEYAAILESVADELPDNPVLRIELAKARIEDARRASNAAVTAGDAEAPALTEITAALESSLRAELDEVSSAALTDSSTPPGVFYQLAVGYDLLGEVENSTAALESLERTEEGRRMAERPRYQQFLNQWIAVFDADTATRLEVTERWLPRFQPSWTNDHSRHRAILGMQFDLLVAAAKEEAAAAGDPEPSSDGVAADQPSPLTEDEADRIATIGRRLARIDTWGGASHYVETASVLARTPSHYVTAVRVTEDGIEALREGRAGLIYPGTPANEREQLRMRYLAVLMQLQGQALHNLDRDDDAEQVLREAMALHPVAASYAVLGGLLLDQDREAEAFDLFVAALAHGFSAAETTLEEQTRASALEAAARIGASPDVIDAAVGFAAERFAEERDREIVAETLDTPAPDFELADTAGGSWRLADLAGKVVVLNYWATWCGPCIAEMPYYQQLVDEYADAEDVVFLAISTDSDPSIVAPFIEERGHTFTVLYDGGSAIDFQVTGVPTTFLVGKDGLIKYRTSGFPGPERYLGEMRLRIEALLAAQR